MIDINKWETRDAFKLLKKSDSVHTGLHIYLKVLRPKLSNFKREEFHFLSAMHFNKSK